MNDGNTTNISIVVKDLVKDLVKDDGTICYEVRTSNGEDNQLVEAHQLEVISPDPSFVPTDSSEIDPNEMAKYLTKLDLA